MTQELAHRIRQVLAQEDYGQGLVTLAQQQAERLARSKLKMSQVRKFFHEMRTIEGQWEHRRDEALRRLVMLKPKLAYQEARIDGFRMLREVLEPGIDYVLEHPEAFPRLMDFFEALLAYFYQKRPE